MWDTFNRVLLELKLEVPAVGGWLSKAPSVSIVIQWKHCKVQEVELTESNYAQGTELQGAHRDSKQVDTLCGWPVECIILPPVAERYVELLISWRSNRAVDSCRWSSMGIWASLLRRDQDVTKSCITQSKHWAAIFDQDVFVLGTVHVDFSLLSTAHDLYPTA